MRLLSFGEIIWDKFPTGDRLGGAPLNLAAHMALLGAESYILSAVGNDSEGKLAAEIARGLGIHTDYLTILDTHPTGSCSVSLDMIGTPSYTLAPCCAYDSIPEPSLCGEEFDCLAFGTLALRERGNQELLSRLMRKCRFKEIYCDLNIRQPHSRAEAVRFCLESASIVKISLEELDFVTEAALGGRRFSLTDAVYALSEGYPSLKLIIITLAEFGSICYERSADKLYTAAAVPCEAVSSVGAGDSFGAAFLWKYSQGGSIPECLELASKISSYVVSCEGAIPEGMKEYLDTVKK